ncbi:MAG: hypothetical protein K1X64_20995 [Myxococcaceae bacterium]|nr:hypothetical protein [Myxococcaceae bacterium]
MKRILALAIATFAFAAFAGDEAKPADKSAKKAKTAEVKKEAAPTEAAAVVDAGTPAAPAKK